MRLLINTFTLLFLVYSTAGCSTKSSEATVNTEPRSLALHLIQPMFDTFDCEHVGIVQAGEVDEHYHGYFKAADVDNSRDLTEQEYLRSIYDKNETLDKAIFSQMDSNKDGSVNNKEFRNYVIQAITTADSDHDGDLTEQEAEMQHWRKPISP